jgi:hypothetical protein
MRNPELLPLAVNIIMCGISVWGGELGKSLYWLEDASEHFKRNM